MDYLGIPLLLSVVLMFFKTCESLTCDSPQYIKLASSDTINCFINESVAGIYWYNSTDSTNNAPMLSREGSKEAGLIYPSERFTILENGSLYIKDVSLRDEKIYRTVVLHDKSTGLTEIQDINVIVKVTSFQDYPIIDQCGKARICFKKVSGRSLMECSVKDTKPAVMLEWSMRTNTGDIVFSSNTLVFPSDNWFTSSSNITTKGDYPLALFVCKITSPQDILVHEESLILVENELRNISWQNPVFKTVELGTSVTFDCEVEDSPFVKWERKTSDGNVETIAYELFGKNSYKEEYFYEFQVNNNGSLIIQDTKVEHDGLFACHSISHVEHKQQVFNLSIFANPKPAYPVVEGCSHDRFCVLRVNKEGRLTCTVYGIRPLVKLQWVWFGESLQPVSLHDQEYTIKAKTDGTFDVSLTASYQVEDRSLQRLTVECKTTDTELKLSSNIELLFVSEPHLTPTPSTPDSPNLQVLLVLLVIPVMCGLFLLVLVSREKAHQLDKRKFNGEKEEDIPMIQQENQDEKIQKRGIFVEQLKRKYEKLCNALQPIPYIRDAMYKVNEVFINSGIEILTLTKSSTKENSWKRLNSYHDLLKTGSVSKLIIEGDPGYGKSTLALQMAYDWCHRVDSTALKDVEIMILIRLRQLEGIISIYTAIRLLLLPIDTTLNDSDIEDILQSCSSLLIFLDGFDEFRDQDKPTDVNRIIEGQMLQNCNAALSTRPRYLPKQFLPASDRIRLCGFDDSDQTEYIKKALIDNDLAQAEKIKRYVNENPVLRDLCQVPLFFVMFAHLTSGNEDFRKVKSVTSFFRLVVAGLHSHMQNKDDIRDSLKSEDQEENHEQLDKLAFEALKREKGLQWKKEEILKEIGSNVYDKYLRLGILCEEQILTNVNVIDGITSEKVDYMTVVRFYHKLFCEWYAGYFLAKSAEQFSFTELEDLLGDIDSTQVRYTFQFACGLKERASSKLIDYLTMVQGDDNLATLCLMEKTEKFDDVKKAMEIICSKDILFHDDDNKLKQKSTIQLLEIASYNGIPIERVWLRGCLLFGQDVKGGLMFKNNHLLPTLSALKRLFIYDETVDLNSKETVNVIKYGLSCTAVEEIWFHQCLLPEVLPLEDVVDKLMTRNVQVFWSPSTLESLKLHSTTGRWLTLDNIELTDSEYLERVKYNLFWIEIINSQESTVKLSCPGACLDCLFMGEEAQ